MAVIIHTQHKCIACGQPERVHMQNGSKCMHKCVHMTTEECTEEKGKLIASLRSKLKPGNLNGVINKQITNRISIEGGRG